MSTMVTPAAPVVELVRRPAVAPEPVREGAGPEPTERDHAPEAASAFARADFTSAKLGLVAAEPSG